MKSLYPVYLYQYLQVIWFVSLLLAGFSLNGQIIAPRPEDIYDEAEEYVFAGDYQEALPLYIDLYEKGYSNANINYKIGVCYLNLSALKTRAIPFLTEAVKHVSQVYSGELLDESCAPVKSFLYLGIARRINHDFDLAESAFHAFMDYLDETDSANRTLARYHLERCENARELIASPVTLKTDTLSGEIDILSSNFNPLVTDDEKILYYNEKLKFYDAVMRSVEADHTWSAPENITPKIKSDGDHHLTGMSLNGDILLLSAYDAYMSGEIYTTEYINNRWRPLQLLNDNINTQFNETHASLSQDGNILYFTSDRPGGYGGLDIYRSERDITGDWGPAQNLGPIVNTPYNEETPFVSGDPVVLFFSSQGHYNMGGYDIFYSGRQDNGTWQHPVNIGYPVNSPDHDLFYYPLPSGQAAYRSVFGKNNSDLNIVRYEVLKPGNPERYAINGNIVLEDGTGSGKSDVRFFVISRPENDTIGNQLLNDDGTFHQKVPSGSFMLEIKDKNRSVFSTDLEIPPYFPQKELIFNASIAVPSHIAHDTLILRHIRFEFDKIDIGDDARFLLDSLALLLHEYPGIEVTLNGYTDAIGTKSYNMKLSLDRAGRTRNYLCELDIVPDRLKVNGFGESHPAAVNSTSDGRDSPEGRKFNRRVEIILRHVPENLTVIEEYDVPENLQTK